LLRLTSVELRSAGNGAAVSAKAHIAKRCEGAKRAVLKLKKRHVKSLTRLPTKRMATACWAFIVVKTTRLETAPMLDFSSLQAANSENHPQIVHNALWMGWGLLRCPVFVAETG
jgi:hypothetical protein